MRDVSAVLMPRCVRDVSGILASFSCVFVPISAEQIPQPAEESVAASFVERAEASHVGWNLA